MSENIDRLQAEITALEIEIVAREEIPDLTTDELEAIVELYRTLTRKELLIGLELAGAWWNNPPY